MAGFIPDGDAAVVFGVVSISIGSGKFSRTKNVFINFAGKSNLLITFSVSYCGSKIPL